MDLEVPVEVLRATARFMCEASGIYKDEDTRRFAIRPTFINLSRFTLSLVI